MERSAARGSYAGLRVWIAGTALLLATVLAAPAMASQGKHKGPPALGSPSSVPLAQGGIHGAMLPAPPRPPSAALPTVRPSVSKAPAKATLSTSPTALPSTLASRLAANSLQSLGVSLPTNAYAGAPGSNPDQRTLVLYDTTGTWGWLGEAYAVMAGQLASHGSAWVMQPAVDYTAGELDAYTGLIYIGSTYDEPLPTAMLDDVLATSKPVLWMNDNIWQLSQRATDFAGTYGWVPQYFSFANALTVTYKGVNLQRSSLAVPSGLLQTVITDPSRAQAIATATDDTGAVTPWATRSGNFTYIGEIPFSYVGPNDRYLAAADLISQVSNPAMQSRHRALVRIEDVSADDDPKQLRRIADYLYQRGVPFSVAVIPQYLDPNGYYNGGVPVSVSLSQDSQLVKALKYMQARGGTLIMHGYTHQYSNVANPYSGVTADDFEFYRSHISPDNYVIYDAPPAEDSATWAQARIDAGLAEFAAAGLPAPTIFEPPHYAASAVDYQVFQQDFGVRYDRGLYAAGWCPDGYCGAGTPDYTRIYGQYFPYLIRDIFGTVVIPEGLGNVEPLAYNHNPPRSPQDILYTAQMNTVINDGVESFFFHPYLPLSDLKTIVQGLQSMGYQFVSASTVAGG